MTVNGILIEAHLKRSLCCLTSRECAALLFSCASRPGIDASRKREHPERQFAGEHLKKHHSAGPNICSPALKIAVNLQYVCAEHCMLSLDRKLITTGIIILAFPVLLGGQMADDMYCLSQRAC